jgi:hypothetical protein
MTTSIDLSTILAALPAMSATDLATIRAAADKALLPMEEAGVLDSARELIEALAITDVAYVTVCTSEWDNGHFFDPRSAGFFTADDKTIALDPAASSTAEVYFTFLGEALTDLSGGGPVGYHSEVRIDLAKNRVLGDY